MKYENIPQNAFITILKQQKKVTILKHVKHWQPFFVLENRSLKKGLLTKIGFYFKVIIGIKRQHKKNPVNFTLGTS